MGLYSEISHLLAIVLFFASRSTLQCTLPRVTFLIYDIRKFQESNGKKGTGKDGWKGIIRVSWCRRRCCILYCMVN
ncbi:uncharacterized protein BKA55DRAFT_94453 [Fusarium redolens]|uniref:Secreted protein n=1 Tax=Fusarium redolens TaxID=48865 RepID=A0A9P9GPN0_FUSRE|nr:uncharacterized protein BKA55DRAFT_94453 [Fusarium redolens]KAH7243423.1 hypothetical protein BKA55DRAFT_94453 [Fusarium redolens]